MAGLPFDNLPHDSISDLGDQRLRNIGVMKLFERGGDLAGSHPFGVQRQDLVVHCSDQGLIFLVSGGSKAL